MNFLDELGGAIGGGHKVTIQTRLTPPFSFNVGAGTSSAQGPGLELGPLLRPKITVDGFEIAPYGEPEEWIVYVELGLALLLGLYLLKKL